MENRLEFVRGNIKYILCIHFYLFSSVCMADYSITLGFRLGGQPYNTLPSISPELLPNVNDSYVLASNVEIAFASGQTDYPASGSYWGCWGGTSSNGANNILGSTNNGYIQSGNDDYAFIFGRTGQGGNAFCAPGRRWLPAGQGHTYYVCDNYLKLVRIAKTGDTTPIQYPKVYLCLMPTDRGGSDFSKCEQYTSLNTNSAWVPNLSTAIVEPPAAACTAEIQDANGTPVVNNGTIALDTISTYSTIGEPPKTLYSGETFSVVPSQTPGENCADFSHTEITFTYSEVSSLGTPVVTSTNSTAGFVIKKRAGNAYISSGETLPYTGLTADFKVNYWALQPNPSVGSFRSVPVTLEIKYN